MPYVHYCHWSHSVLGLKPEWRARGIDSSSRNSSFSDSSRLKFLLLGYNPSTSEFATSSTDTATDNRQIIHMDHEDDDIDFVTLHNILYYIYTGCVNLNLQQGTPTEEYYPRPDGYPDPADPYCLYRSADKFLLAPLKEKCFEYLKHSMTPENIAERLFDGECEHYEPLKTLYLGYLLENYDIVKWTEGWERAVCDEDISPCVGRYRQRLLFDISKRLRM